MASSGQTSCFDTSGNREEASSCTGLVADVRGISTNTRLQTTLVVVLSKPFSFISDATAAPAAVGLVASIVDSEEGFKPDSEVV